MCQSLAQLGRHRCQGAQLSSVQTHAHARVVRRIVGFDSATSWSHSDLGRGEASTLERREASSVAMHRRGKSEECTFDFLACLAIVGYV